MAVSSFAINGSSVSDSRKRFFTVAQAADLLGLSHSTLFRAIRAGEFPAIKVRGRYVIPAKAIDQMESSALASGLVAAADLSLTSLVIGGRVMNEVVRHARPEMVGLPGDRAAVTGTLSQV